MFSPQMSVVHSCPHFLFQNIEVELGLTFTLVVRLKVALGRPLSCLMPPPTPVFADWGRKHNWGLGILNDNLGHLKSNENLVI